MSRNVLVDVAVLMDQIRDKNYDDSTLKLIITKKLFNSDVAKKQNRLSMPLKSDDDDFLNPKEKMILTEKGVVVGFIGPCRKEMTMVLKKRKKTYVLIKNWYEIAMENGLKEGDTVQVWFFRDRDRDRKRPCFALVLDTAQPF